MNTSIWDAYLTYALPIALFHLVFLIVCLNSWRAELSHLKKEKKAYADLKANNFVGGSNGQTEIEKLAAVALSMTVKGEILGPDLLKFRLAQPFIQYDIITRACLNAFVISGLLGTLYNLWKLGPSFWEGLLRNQPGAGQPAIGIAFSASVFGLSAALILTLIDAIWIRRSRERFIQAASSYLFDMTAKLFPPKEGAAVADALERFYDTSKGFLLDLKFQHEDMSRQLVHQIDTSSKQLNDTLLQVSDSWRKLANSATDSIYTLGGRLEVEIKNLTEATGKGSHLLDLASLSLEEAQRLNSLLIEVRAEAISIQEKLASQLAEFITRWEADLTSASRQHVERLENASAAGWKRYEDEATYWHQQNAVSLKRFSDDLEKLLSEWGVEQEKMGGYIDGLISGWRGELGRNITGMQGGLAELRAEIERLVTIASHLSKSNDTAIQQLQALQSGIIAFSQSISNGTPVGSAMDTMTEAVRDFQSFIRSSRSPVAAPNNLATISKPESTPVYKESVAQFEATLMRIENHVSAIRQTVYQGLDKQERSFVRRRWRQLTNLFR